MSFRVTFREDGSCHVVGRLTLADGSGAATGIAGEGNWAEPADISTITYAVYDVSEADAAIIAATSVTVADVVLDPPVTSTALWSGNAVGYNFKHRIPKTAFPENHVYRIEYTFTPTAGATYAWTEPVEGLAESVTGS